MDIMSTSDPRYHTNILIASHCGFTRENVDTGRFDWFGDGVHLYASVGLEFHISWDWLIPAIGLLNPIIVDGSYTESIDYISKIKLGLSRCDINATYSEIVQYIKWHNQNTKYDSNSKTT